MSPDLSSTLDRLGDEIAELAAHLDAATARLLDLIREFDARGGWNTGFLSCAAWLTWRVGLDPGAARERVRVARALGTLPRLAQALARGELSYAKVRALTRVATPETEERLLAVGRAGTAAHVERIVRGWRRVDRLAEARETARRHTSRALHVYQDEDGMMIVRGRVAPEVGALLVQALAAARETLYERARATDASAGPADVSAETPTLAQQQADALGLLAETALHHGIDPGAPGERYQVVVHVDAPVLADPEAPGQSVLEDGTHVSYETPPLSRRLFDQHDVVAQAFEATDVVTADPVGILAIKVVGPEIAMRNTVLQHVPQRDDHRVLHCHDRFLGTTPGPEPVVERAVVTLPAADRRPGGFLQGRTQPRRALARRRGSAFPRALVIARTQSRPRGEVRRRGELAHVDARFGDDRLCGTRGDAGHALHERRRFGERGHRPRDPGIERGDMNVQRIDQGQMLLEQECVVRSKAADEGFAQRGPLLAEVTLRAVSQPHGIVDARAERLENGATCLPHDIGDDTAELQLRQFQRLRDAIDVLAPLADERLP